MLQNRRSILALLMLQVDVLAKQQTSYSWDEVACVCASELMLYTMHECMTHAGVQVVGANRMLAPLSSPIIRLDTPGC